MAKHAEDLTIAPFDMVEYTEADHSDPRGPILMTRKKRRIERGLPRPAHASGVVSTSIEVDTSGFIVPTPEPLPSLPAPRPVTDHVGTLYGQPIRHAGRPGWLR